MSDDKVIETATEYANNRRHGGNPLGRDAHREARKGFEAGAAWQAGRAQGGETEPEGFVVKQAGEVADFLISRTEAEVANRDYEGTVLPVYTQPPSAVPEGCVAVTRELYDMALEAMEDFGCDMQEGGNPGTYPKWAAQIIAAAPSCASQTAESERWAACSERLPTAEDSDCHGEVWAFNEVRQRVETASWYSVTRYYEGIFRHWKPTGLTRPEPPEDDQ